MRSSYRSSSRNQKGLNCCPHFPVVAAPQPPYDRPVQLLVNSIVVMKKNNQHLTVESVENYEQCDNAGLGLGLGSGFRLDSRLGLGLGLVLGS